MPFPWWTLPPGIQLHPHNLENDFLVWITKISIWNDCATWILDVAFRYHQPSSWWLNHPPHPFEGHMRTVIIGSFPPRKSGWKFKKHLSCHQLAFHQRFFSTNGGMSAPKNEKKLGETTHSKFPLRAHSRVPRVPERWFLRSMFGHAWLNVWNIDLKIKLRRTKSTWLKVDFVHLLKLKLTKCVRNVNIIASQPTPPPNVPPLV